MKRLSAALAATATCLLLAAAPAGAAFGLNAFDVTFTNPDGTTNAQAGSHPFAMTTSFNVNSSEGPGGEPILEEAAKVLEIGQVTGFAGNPTAVPQCSSADFLLLGDFGASVPRCDNSSAVGIVKVTLAAEGGSGKVTSPVYNLVPPPGVAAKLGFWTSNVPTTIEIGVSESPPYNVLATVRNISQVLEVVASQFTLWGNPAATAHDKNRGPCVVTVADDSCSAGIEEKPLLLLPRACEGPLATTYKANSWQNPGAWVAGSALTHDGAGNPRGMSGCAKLGFGPQIDSQPTTRSAESPSGLDFDVAIADEGIANPAGIAHSDVKKAVVTLPEGVTVNPSQAEGLGVCSEADFARERANSGAGAGCPQEAKIGTVAVQTPLLENRTLHGSLYVAEPYANRFGTLIALYMTIKSPELGINVGLAGKVEPDPRSGQLITTFDNLPQLPFSHFHLHFREGARSPLVTPPACGTYTTVAEFTPWGSPAQPHRTTSSFQVSSGINGAPCPQGGIPPFSPGFEAGTLNNNAGSYSPFYMRLIRSDGEQDMTKFSSILPPGVVGKLAGVQQCADAAIAAAKSRNGREELAAPSCPANSKIGRVLAGAGVGGALTYVPGQIYLAGPYNGAPLSVAVITPAVAGPFDAGTVVVRVALRIDPRTAEVQADGAASDPIPHILQGIPLKVRDIRVYVDRDNFILNPTSCDPSQTKATLFGGFLDVFSAADDIPVDLSSRFQAASCANLGFAPRLAMTLKGGTKRGDHPALRGVFRPRPGDANLADMVLRLPRSAFLDQAHIRTICTRVQFAADNCPAAAAYGHARAFTPLLEAPLEGPVYLRSSDNFLPDFVADLRGIVDVEAIARIDSVKGGIRASFENTPDAPLTKVVVSMQGGKRGLIVNSRNLCDGPNRARAQMQGHNGKRRTIRPRVRALGCNKKKQKRGAKRSGHRRGR